MDPYVGQEKLRATTFQDMVDAANRFMQMGVENVASVTRVETVLLYRMLDDVLPRMSAQIDAVKHKLVDGGFHDRRVRSWISEGLSVEETLKTSSAISAQLHQ